MDNIKERVILITGASKGIGAEIAKAFAKEGACLSLVATGSGGPKEFDDVVQQCKDLGAKDAMKICTDLSKNENMEMVVNKTIETFERLDVLVNNAGILGAGSIETIKLEDYDKCLNINTRTPLYLTQLAIPHLEKTKGNIINMSTIFSTMPTASDFLPYSLSKIALDQLTRITALDLAKKGIRVNAVRPGTIETPILSVVVDTYNLDLESVKQLFSKKQPLGLGETLIQPEHVADAVIFLASEKASMITGAFLTVDGAQILLG